MRRVMMMKTKGQENNDYDEKNRERRQCLKKRMTHERKRQMERRKKGKGQK